MTIAERLARYKHEDVLQLMAKLGDIDFVEFDDFLDNPRDEGGTIASFSGKVEAIREIKALLDRYEDDIYVTYDPKDYIGLYIHSKDIFLDPSYSISIHIKDLTGLHVSKIKVIEILPDGKVLTGTLEDLEKALRS